MIERLKQAIRRDDSPGYTDHPEVDIQAHRSNARLTKWLGIATFVAGVLWYLQSDEIVGAALGVSILFVCFSLEMALRVQALEWEVQLEREDDDA